MHPQGSWEASPLQPGVASDGPKVCKHLLQYPLPSSHMCERLFHTSVDSHAESHRSLDVSPSYLPVAMGGFPLQAGLTGDTLRLLRLLELLPLPPTLGVNEQFTAPGGEVHSSVWLKRMCEYLVHTYDCMMLGCLDDVSNTYTCYWDTLSNTWKLCGHEYEWGWCCVIASRLLPRGCECTYSQRAPRGKWLCHGDLCAPYTICMWPGRPL